MSGIQVSNATYGVGSTTVDVTGTVSAAVKDGVLSIPSVTATSLNVSDPAPGQIKTLHVSYSINGGSTLVSDVKDSNSLYINAPPARVASGLQITKAEYGYPGNFTDVTDAIQNHVSSGSINITVGYKVLGLPDPNPSKQKQLNVEYTINGAKNSNTLTDGQQFKESAPPMDAPDNGTPSQHATSLIGMLLMAVARFFAVYLHTLSFFTALSYGEKMLSPMIWGCLAFFIPFFSFWALPMITFVIRLFSSSDFI
jgi:hypothetical protein